MTRKRQIMQTLTWQRILLKEAQFISAESFSVAEYPYAVKDEKSLQKDALLQTCLHNLKNSLPWRARYLHI